VKVARRLFLATQLLALMLEALPYSTDLAATIGWYLHQDIKKWLPVGLPFSLMELLLLVAAGFWLARGRRDRRAARYEPGRLMVPLLAFGAAVALGVVWGLLRGGDNLTFALFEVRGLGMLVFAYLLVGMLFRDDQDLGPLIWCILLACAGLALQDIYRYYFVYGRFISSDLMFEHDDSLILGFGAILCLTLLAFNGTRAQLRMSVILFPCLVFCLAVMKRRAAWPVLVIGLIVLAIMLYRTRPKVFWRTAPVVLVLLAGYLAVFWNSTGTLGQPARAIRSQISPDPRDASSDLYRQIEHYDIVANIRGARLLGLGFGQPYVFYEGLPDLSFWPFWHYESHNSVLWLWMDGGIPVFFTFLWLAGAGLAAGGQEMNARREAWTLPRVLRRRARASAPAGVTRAGRAAGRRSQRETPGVVIAAAPERMATEVPGAKARGPSTALLAAAICYIPMQIMYSYVDLGLINPRDMLLYGVALGIAGRSFAAHAAAMRAARPRAQHVPARDAVVPTVPASRLVTAERT
jgi:hypothetical protein